MRRRGMNENCPRQIRRPICGTIQGSDTLKALKNANLALAFLLELCALAALGYWGFRIGDGALAKIALGLGAPLLMAVFWGIFLAPRAVVRLPTPLIVALKVIVFGVAALALAAAGSPVLAAIFAVVVVINLALAYGLWA